MLSQEGGYVPKKWRVCIDYRNLNAVTKKDHFLLQFIDQILDKILGQRFYCFLDGYSGYNQLAIHPDDQEKMTFTYSFGICISVHAIWTM